MSATMFFAKAFTPRSGRWFTIGLYIVKSICLVAGAAFMAMKQSDWESMWALNRWGWGLLLLGNIANTWAAAISSSTRPANPPAQ